jgi:hypothetical protein
MRGCGVIWAIVGGVGLAGVAGACGIGIPVESGEVGGVRWRTRWACNRVKVEVKRQLAGGGTTWEQIGSVRGFDRETLSDARLMAEGYARGVGGAPAVASFQPMVKVSRLKVKP